MHKKIRCMTLLILLSFFIPFCLWGQTVPAEGLASITPDEMKAHVYYLASDAMKGRNTPSSELDSCAAYIARQFASYNLQPVSKENPYNQTFYVLKARLGEPNTLAVTTPQGTTQYEIKKDFVPLHLTANRKVSGSLVLHGILL